MSGGLPLSMRTLMSVSKLFDDSHWILAPVQSSNGLNDVCQI